MSMENDPEEAQPLDEELHGTNKRRTSLPHWNRLGAGLRERLAEIFPTKWLTVFFLVYILLYILNAILIRLSKRMDQNAYDYDITSAVLFTELLKLALACSFYLWEGHSICEVTNHLIQHRRLALFYLVPATLYAVYNNLTYISLSYFDPTTYYILLQLRIAVTGVVYQIIFQRILSRSQWLSLLLLTAGCIIKQLASFNFNNAIAGNGYFISFSLIAIQISCSCLAGVYTEYLLKGEQQKQQVHLMIQNMYMYLDSIACNLVAITYNHGNHVAERPLLDLAMFANPLVMSIVLVNAFCGLSTSYFIKTFNSIMKSYTVGIELLLTALICRVLFYTPLDGFTMLSILVVSYATYLFARNPVISRPVSTLPVQRSKIPNSQTSVL